MGREAVLSAAWPVVFQEACLMSDKPVIISVIMPSLNVRDTIRQCMDSVLAQTLKEIEILCIDAGSTDGTLDILQEYARVDPRIRLLSSIRKSYGHQVNIGISAASGQYVSIVETDDYIDPDMYLTLFCAAEKNSFPDVIKSGYNRCLEYEVGTETEVVYPTSAPDGTVFSIWERDDLLEAHPSIWTCLYRRDFLVRHHIHMIEPPGAGWTDNLFLYQTLCEADRICWVRKPLYTYRALKPVFRKDCNTPFDRINDIKDYLESRFPKNRRLELLLLRRLIIYIRIFELNPNLDDAHRELISQTLRRFGLWSFARLDQDSIRTCCSYYSLPRYITSIPPSRAKLHKIYLGLRHLRHDGITETVKIVQEKVAQRHSPPSPIPTEVALPDKQALRVLFISSDNNCSSGAFLSMLTLNKILRDKYGLETFVILPCEGTGSPLLANAEIPHCLVPSCDWVLPLSVAVDDQEKEAIAKKKAINEEAIKKINSIIVRHQFDLVHINTTYSYVGAIAAQRAGIPYVWHLREFLEEDQGNTLWDRETGNQIIGQADRVITISDALYRKYSAWIGVGRLRRIYNGIDTKTFYMPDHAIFQSQSLVFTMVGAIYPAKGQLEFATACVKLYQSGFHDFRIQFLGTGEEHDVQQVREILNAGGLAERACFLGYCDNVREYLQQSDLSFSCAVSEAFGRTTVEAMMSGNLVIGANTAGTKELIQDGVTGYLYQQGNPDDLCKTIQKAIQNPEQSREIASNGRQHMVKTMSAEINADNIFALYQEMLHEYAASKKGWTEDEQ